MTAIPTMRLSGPADIAAAVPYLLGFHPEDSLVMLGLSIGSASRNQVTFTARIDLIGDSALLAQESARIVANQRQVHAIIMVGYGESERAVTALAACAERMPVPVAAAIRVTGGRCFCVLDDCIPADGLPIVHESSRVAAEATYHGLAALPDRAAVARQVAPIGGLQVVAMTEALDRAAGRLAELLASASSPGDPGSGRVLQRTGVLAVDEAMAAARHGRFPDDGALAWLTLLLESLPVRDHAWESTDHEDWQLRFWLDATRRAHPDLVAPPASLLAFAAWRAGEGPLASVALDRALASDPHYGLALLIRDAIGRGIGPEVMGVWPLPAPRRARRRGNRGGSRRRRGRSGRVLMRETS